MVRRRDHGTKRNRAKTVEAISALGQAEGQLVRQGVGRCYSCHPCSTLSKSDSGIAALSSLDLRYRAHGEAKLECRQGSVGLWADPCTGSNNSVSGGRDKVTAKTRQEAIVSADKTCLSLSEVKTNKPAV